jgi:hypothetical protein
MQSPTRPVLLFLGVLTAFVVGIPLLVWSLLPAGFRLWLDASEELLSVLGVILFVSLAMGTLTGLGFWTWRAIARRVFDREYIDALIASWSKPR